MREDEVRALEALERAWGISQLPAAPSVVCPLCGTRSFHPKDVEYRYCVRCHAFHDDIDPKTGVAPDDGEAPPNFLLVEQTERETFGLLKEAPTWAEWTRETCAQLPPLFTLETPWLTAAVCVVTVLCTAAVLMVALGKSYR